MKKNEDKTTTMKHCGALLLTSLIKYKIKAWRELLIDTKVQKETKLYTTLNFGHIK